MNQLGPQQAHEINACGSIYGLCGNDFFSFLTRDLEEQEALRLAREQEEEKAMYSVSSQNCACTSRLFYKKLNDWY